MELERRELDEDDLIRMNIPDNLRKCSLEQVSPKIKPTVQNYINSIHLMHKKGAGLIIGGSTGVGKSAIASLILREARSVFHTSYFISIWELRENIKNKVMFDEVTTTFDRCKDVRFLVLDDFKLEDLKDFTLGEKQIRDLLSWRISKNKVSIMTTKLNKRELFENTPDLYESIRSKMIYIEVTGDNKRRSEEEVLKNLILK